MNILFVCKFNRFRSKIAEAFFNKLNNNSKYFAKSAGIIKGRTITNDILKPAKEFGLKIKSQPIGLSVELLMWADLIIITADDVPKTIFTNNFQYSKKVNVWKIHDVNGNKMIKEIIKIQNHVTKLIYNLEKP